MKVGDTASGVLSIALGAAVAASAWSFPAAPGHPVGAGAFPAAIGCALAAAGVVLLVGSLRQRAGATWIELPPWTRSRRLVSNFALVVAAVVFYALAVDRVGFLITAVLFLAVLFAAFGVRRSRILPLAVAVTMVLHFGFYTLLRVPLPWGVLEGIAW